MRAVEIGTHGDRDQLRIVERPDPVPKAGEVRVRVRAAALNHLDVWVRKGVPGVRYPLPLIPGCDGAGLIEAVGEDVSGLEVGAPVVLAPGLSCGACAVCAAGDDHLCRHYGILGEHRDGTMADLVVVPAANVLAKPESLSFEEAAAVPLAYLTAWHMVRARANVQPGEVVLVHAAGSGVSSAAIQMAAFLGARVLATAGSREKLDRAMDLGAELGINYRESDFAEAVRAHTGKRGVDVIVDHVGADTWDGNIRSLARGGRLVFCGNTSGVTATTSLPHVWFRNAALLGSTMGSRGELYTVLDLVGRGELTPVLDRVLPMEQVAEGHRLLEEREAFGKVVLTPW